YSGSPVAPDASVGDVPETALLRRGAKVKCPHGSFQLRFGQRHSSQSPRRRSSPNCRPRIATHSVNWPIQRDEQRRRPKAGRGKYPEGEQGDSRPIACDAEARFSRGETADSKQVTARRKRAVS